MVRCTVLVENHPLTSTFEAEHGLSLLLETGRERWLFDLGQSDLFLKNAKVLQTSLQPLQGVVISHGHYDHGGGLETFLQHDVVTPIYLHPSAFDDYYNGREKYIGLKPHLATHPQLKFLSETTSLSPEATLVCLPLNADVEPRNAYGLMRCDKGSFEPDDFRHEVALLLTVEGRKICISGCAHCGVLNWLAAVKPDVFIGGFHLAKLNPEVLDDRERLVFLATTLATTPTVYYTGHCTGDEPYAFLKARLGNRLQALASGAIFEI
ncbi:MAG: MBL fold metallo-hydrolase [bacterium]|nr:MBL fold metallo-hydrolase [bacterium]